MLKVYAKTNIGLEEYYLLGYNAMYYVESQQTFRRNTLPPFSGSKNKLSKCENRRQTG
jgi:hypothetical protein